MTDQSQILIWVLEHIIDYIYLPVNERETSDELHFSTIEFVDLMKPVKPIEYSILPYFKPTYKCSYTALKPERINELIVTIRCVRIKQ